MRSINIDRCLTIIDRINSILLKYNVKGTLNIPYYDESTTAINVAFASA